MLAVIFEVTPKAQGKPAYLDLADSLRPLLQQQPGLISIERFQSLVEEGKLLSLSFWESEAAIASWRRQMDHQLAQNQGRESLFHSYRIRVGQIVRDYTHDQRQQAPH
ncbi:Heme-degrading monooxygenase HmoA [Ferrimonas sediminum]|uniref:Heme-degrading monooxygenase HmoA n=1 Tax=Ferrimonas sediminum TaxID=718193 RepID=A0A1G8R5F5_9GAMM|nr:antibiotic biosynthesis monooxygenase [Ferrimonas sediminum]SDJ12202.1 Heme-degrading monooxygenase HmoA [Ferrimonas sediminum]